MKSLLSSMVAACKNTGLRLQARWQPRDVLDTPLVSALIGMTLLGASCLPFAPGRKLALLTAATRRLDRPGLLAVGRLLMQRWLTPGQVDVWRRRQIGWHRYYAVFGNIARDRALTTSLLLKEPGENGEKGVLYCSFEFNWMKLVANHDARRLLRDYYLVGASSWSPSDHAVLANLCGLSEDPAFIGISNYSDLAQYQLFPSDIFPLPLMACDWVDPDDFHPLPREQRSIDILMVAHFAAWKRHWLLFEALRDLPHDLHVVLIGRNAPGRTERELREEAGAFGVRQQLTIHANLEIKDVMNHQCNAKVAVALSKREGSCVSVTESLFADTPVIMMADAHIGARVYMNNDTGRIVTRQQLPQALHDMLGPSASCAPRAWACEHISASASSRKLNAILQQHSLNTGKPWTRDITPMCWRYVPRYLDMSDRIRMRPGLERLRAHHGIILEEFVSEQHAMRKSTFIATDPLRPAGRATG